MIVLALDTATAHTCVALRDGQTLLAERHMPARSHSKSLIPSVHELLGDSGVGLDDLELIGVGIGPGSFTGIRIGLTVAKTLAFARDLPLVGVSSLHALAHNVDDDLTQAVICPALDALKNEVYCAVYSMGEEGLVQLQAPAAKKPHRWARELREDHQKVFILGSALEKYMDIFRDALGDRLGVPSSEEQNIIRAGFIGEIATAKFRQAGADDAADLEPLYCRLSEAELSRMKKS